MRLIQFLHESPKLKLSVNTLKLITNILSRNIGEVFFPFGGKNNQEEFKSSDGRVGTGVRYITPSGKMFRFNWLKGKNTSETFSSVDIWYKIKHLAKPDKTISFPVDFNIVQSIDMVTKAFSMPIGELELNEEEPLIKRKRGRPKKIVISAGQSEESSLTISIKKSEKTLQNTKFADVETIFDDLESLVYVVAKGSQPSLLITGMPGVGKTYIVKNVLLKHLGTENEDWFMVKGKASTLGLYSTLFLHRDKLIVFDDCDSIFQNTDSVNILKGALDSYDTRSISWISPTTINVSKLDKASKDALYADIEDKIINDPQNSKIKYPSQFDFTGKVIFISNISSDKLDNAIKSRSMVIDITLSQQDVIKRIQSILNKIEPDYSLTDKMEVLKFLEEQIKLENKDITMRSFILALKIKTSGLPNWQRLLAYSGS